MHTQCRKQGLKRSPRPNIESDDIQLYPITPGARTYVVSSLAPKAFAVPLAFPGPSLLSPCACPPPLL
eukprot:5850336-Prorocentrum_lima.AAC.1